MRVLVFGKTGQVGRALAQTAWPEGIQLTSLDRQAADFSRPDALGAVVRKHRPNVVLIAAAYTNVDDAEENEALATAVNATAPGIIASEAAALSAPVVYFSTDYVFNGEKPEPYKETDPTAPVGAYGRSKLAGEIAVRAANPRHLILRTSWVYSATGTNFLHAMLRQALSRDEVRVVEDQVGCPTAAGDIAEAIAHTLPKTMAADGPWGTYHLAGGTEVTRHRFAEAIFDQLGARGLRRPRNRPVPSSDYPTPARRPRNGRLSSEKFARTFGLRLPGYQASLPKIIDEALAAIPVGEGAAQ